MQECSFHVLVPECGNHVLAGKLDCCVLSRTVLTMEQAATLCSLDRSTLSRYSKTGRLRTYLIGERRLTTGTDLKRLIGDASSDGSKLQTISDAICSADFNHPATCAKMRSTERYLCPLRFTLAQSASILRVHSTHLAKFASSGELVSEKFEGARRITAFELWTFFENRVDGRNASYGKEA
jgi:hypothetical protein